MTIEDAVIARLLATAAVSAIVATRGYLLRLPQSPTLPAVVVQVLDEAPLYHLRGASALSRARIQIDAYARESSGMNPYTAVAALADAIDAAMSGQVFEIGSPAVSVDCVLRVNRQSMYEPDELRIVRMMQDYQVWYRRS